MPDLSIKGHKTLTDYIYIKDTNYSTLSAFENSLDGVVFAYELATPITRLLTPQQISAIKGTNLFWSDANGNIDITFLK